VAFRKNKRWLWTVMCRRTRQIVAFALGDRSARTCRHLWSRIPEEYRGCASFSDFWEAYQEVLPPATHHRKTLSFSKVDYMHHLVTRWFIIEYNLKIQRAFT
jgi:IS1 family transposase